MLSAEGTSIIIASFANTLLGEAGIAFAGIEPLPFGLRCRVPVLPQVSKAPTLAFEVGLEIHGLEKARRPVGNRGDSPVQAAMQTVNEDKRCYGQ